MLAEKLYQLNSFQRQYEALLILSVGDSISAIERSQKRDELLSLIDWNNSYKHFARSLGKILKENLRVAQQLI